MPFVNHTDKFKTRERKTHAEICDGKNFALQICFGNELFVSAIDEWMVGCAANWNWNWNYYIV